MSRDRIFRLVVFVVTGLIFLENAAIAKAAAKYKVGVDSNPSGAVIFIDGKRVGSSSPDFRVKVGRGLHSIKVDAGDDYVSAEESVTITADRDFTYTLEKKPAKVSVVVTLNDPKAENPVTADLFVNGESKGKIENAGQVLLVEGTYLVEVRKSGYRPYSEKVFVARPNQKGLVVFAKLDPEAKEVKPEPKPAEVKREVTALKIVIPVADQSALGATLYVDGAPAIQGVRTGDSVPVQPGRRRIEVLKEGYQPFGQQIEFAPGATSSLELSLVKLPEPAKNPPPEVNKTGDLLVVVDQPGADVVVDGSKRFKGGELVGKLVPGQHSVQVTLGGYETYTEVVDIKVGEQTVKRVSLKAIQVSKTPRVQLVLAFPAEGAAFYINGRRYSDEQVLGDRGVEVPPGLTTVFVRRDGLGQFRTQFTLPESPELRKVFVELTNQGSLELATDPAPVDIYVDKIKLGATTQAAPTFEKELPAGEYLVEVRKEGGYQDFQQKVVIEPGKVTKLYAALVKPDVPPVMLDPFEVRMSSTSFSAKTIEPGYWNLDVGGGYPYFADIRVSTGILRRQNIGLDAGFEVRTLGYFTEAGLISRFQFVKAGPFVMGTNLFIGGGGGPDGRNNVTFELGIPLSLVFGNRFTFTAHPYLHVFSDEVRLDSDDQAVDDRMTGVRLMLRGVFEIALTSRMNLWLMIEGAPTQQERRIFSSKYVKTMVAPDPFIYGRVGVSFKF